MSKPIKLILKVNYKIMHNELAVLAPTFVSGESTEMVIIVNASDKIVKLLDALAVMGGKTVLEVDVFGDRNVMAGEDAS